MEQRKGRELTSYEKISQTEAFLQATLETNEGHSRGWALQYGERVGDHIKQLEKLKAAKSLLPENVDIAKAVIALHNKQDAYLRSFTAFIIQLDAELISGGIMQYNSANNN